MQDQPGHGVHQYCFAKARARPRSSLTPQRGFHVHVAQRHKLGDPSRSRLKGPQAYQVSGPMYRLLYVTEHDSGCRTQTYFVRGTDYLQPLVRPQLVWANDVADLVIQNLG